FGTREKVDHCLRNAHIGIPSASASGRRSIGKHFEYAVDCLDLLEKFPFLKKKFVSRFGHFRNGFVTETLYRPFDAVKRNFYYRSIGAVCGSCAACARSSIAIRASESQHAEPK